MHSIINLFQVALLGLTALSLTILHLDLQFLDEVRHETFKDRVDSDRLLQESQTVVPLLDLSFCESHNVDITPLTLPVVVDHLDEVVFFILLFIQ